MRGHGIAAVALVFSASCAFTCFQTPEVIPPGHAAIGTGGALIGGSGGVTGEVDVWGRFGVARRIDVGLKGSLVAGSSKAILADVKYQRAEGATKSSIGLGLLGWWDDFEGGHTKFHGLMLVPTALTGKERVYVGLRVPILLGVEGSLISFSNFSVPFGLKVGGPTFISMIEANVHLPYPMICLGLGFQYHL